MTAMILLSAWQESQVEFWLPIKGFEGYDISSFGRVRSWRRRYGRQSTPRIMVPTLTQWGYLRIRLRRSDGIDVSIGVHRLVALAFISNPMNLEQVNHKNVIKADNRLDNLEHMSRSQNIKHAYDNGLFGDVRKGEKNKFSKLTNAQVVDIFRRGKSGYRQGARLAREYGLDKSVVNKILARKAWKHLQLGEN